MNKNNKYFKNHFENSKYERGSKGISIIGKRKFQNLIKDFNNFTKKKIEIKDIKGKWNGYAFPIIDKIIKKKDLTRLQKSKKIQNNKNYKELENYFLTNEDIIKEEFIEIFNKNYPNSYINPNDLITQYISNGRRISKEMINRMYALIISYMRHNNTDYDNYVTKSNEEREHLRKNFNFKIHKEVETWRRGIF